MKKNKRRKKKRHLIRRMLCTVLAASAACSIYIYAAEKKNLYPPVGAAVVSSQIIKEQSIERLLNVSSKDTSVLPLFAHRGFTDNSLENTFASFDEAAAAGLPQVELDVWESSDGVLYVSHDDNLKRVAKVDEDITSMTSTQLDEITLTNGEKLHRLSDVFAHYGNSLIYLVEFKQNLSSVSCFVDLLRAQPKIVPNVQVQSFYAGTLQALEAELPNMLKQLLVETSDELNTGLHLTWIDNIAMSTSLATQSIIEQVHSAGKKAWIWTVDDTESVKRYLQWGADGVITDDKDAVAVVMQLQS